MTKKYEDLEVLKSAEDMADQIWRLVSKWQYFEKDTLGKQITRAADSIGANIAEAFGRYHYGEKLRFLYYARGSLFETKYWLNRLVTRNLLSISEADSLKKSLSGLARQLNGFAKFIKEQRLSESNKTKIKEYSATYSSNADELFSKADLELLDQEQITRNQ